MATVDIKSILTQELTDFLSANKQLAADAKSDLDLFLTQIQPIVDGLLANPSQNSLDSLAFLKDAIGAEIARSGLEVVQKEGVAVTSIVSTALRTAISFAISLI